jgi:hypothetical protein
MELTLKQVARLRGLQERVTAIDAGLGVSLPFPEYQLPTDRARHALLRGLRLLLVKDRDLERPLVFPNGEGGYTVEWRAGATGPDLYVDRRGTWSSWDDPDTELALDPTGKRVN